MTKIIEWFGYKLHLLVDAKHEVVLAYRGDDRQCGRLQIVAGLGPSKAKPTCPKAASRRWPTTRRPTTTSRIDVLHKAGIRPVIQNRRLWKDQTEQMLPGHDGTSNIVYDEAGTVYCYDRTSLPIVRHKMAYIGYEPQRRDDQVPLPGAA